MKKNKKQSVSAGRFVRGITTAAMGIGLLALSTTASADHRPRMGAGVGVGTLGPGATLAVEINRRLETRIGFSQFGTDFEFEGDDLDYSGDIALGSATAILDIYPWTSLGFRLSIGALMNGNELSGVATPNGVVEFGGQTYQGSEIGSARATIDFASTAPYFGLGWGRRTGLHGQFRFALDAGVFMQGEPQVDLQIDNPNGLVSDQDIETARRDIQQELKDFDIYPVITLGFSYAF